MRALAICCTRFGLWRREVERPKRVTGRTACCAYNAVPAPNVTAFAESAPHAIVGQAHHYPRSIDRTTTTSSTEEEIHQ